MPQRAAPRDDEDALEQQMLAAADAMRAETARNAVERAALKKAALKAAEAKGKRKALKPKPKPLSKRFLRTLQYEPGVDPASIDLDKAQWYRTEDVNRLTTEPMRPGTIIIKPIRAKHVRHNPDGTITVLDDPDAPQDAGGEAPATAEGLASQPAPGGGTAPQRDALPPEAQALLDRAAKTAFSAVQQAAEERAEAEAYQRAQVAAGLAGRADAPQIPPPAQKPFDLKKRIPPALPNDYEGMQLFYNLMQQDRGIKLPPHLRLPVMALMDQRIKNLLIIIGPGAGKSLLLSVCYPAFAIGQDPESTILGLSAGEALPQGFMSAVMQWIEHDPFYSKIFPGVRPDKDRGWSTDRGLFVRGHAAGDPDASYFAAGLTSKALTGKHARIIIGDDLHDKENSSSTDACMRVRDSYYQQIIGRADPRGARFIFAGRRWHEEDIYGHLKSTGEWVVLELPAVRPGEKNLYWDVTIPEGLVCCFNEPVARTSVLGDAGAAAEKAASAEGTESK